MKINGSSDWEKINNSQNFENSEYFKNSENDYSEKDIFNLSCGDGLVDENSIFVDEENKQIFLDSDLFAEEVTFDDYKNANVNELFELEDLESYNFLTAEKEMSFDDIEFLKLQDSFQITSSDVKLSNDEKRMHEDSESVKKSIAKENFDKHNGDGKIDENSIYFDEENKTIYFDEDFLNQEIAQNILNNKSIDDIDLFIAELLKECLDENLISQLFQLYESDDADPYNVKMGETSMEIPAPQIKEVLKDVMVNLGFDYRTDNINNDIDKTEETVYTTVDENKQKASETSIETSYNKNGDEVKKVIKEYDAEGNLISTQVIEKSYDDFGELREQVSIQYDADGNEQIQLVEKLDVYGNPVEEYTKVINEDGSIDERRTSFGHGDAESSKLYPDTISEEIISKNSNGQVVYKTQSESQIDRLEVLKNLYPDNRKIQSSDSYEEALKICKNNGLIDEMNTELYDNLKLSLSQSDSIVEEMNEEMITSVCEELLSKLDLMVVDDGFLGGRKASYEEIITAILNDETITSYAFDLSQDDDPATEGVIWHNEPTYNGLKPCETRENKAIEDRISTLQDIYNEINLKMYPDGSHGDLGKELLDIKSSKNYFNDVTELDLNSSYAKTDGFNPETDVPMTYGDVLCSQLYEFKEACKNENISLLYDSQVLELCDAYGYSASFEDIEKMLEQYEKDLNKVLETGDSSIKSKAADYINSTLIAVDSMQAIPSEFAIDSDYDPETMIADNYGEMLMEQMNDLKKEYQLYKDQMGDFDRIVSLCSYFGLCGVGEAEVEKMFEVYEQELRALSETEGDEFLHKFKALTGNDFTEDSMINLYSYNLISESVEKLTEEELEQQAELLGIDKKEAETTQVSYYNYYVFNAEGKKEYKGRSDCMSTDPNVVCEPVFSGEYSVDALRVLVKDRLTSGLSQNNKTTDKAIDDWKDTVVEHRDFVVDLARTSATAIVSSTGVGVIGCALTGAIVEATAAAMNANASGEQKLDAKEVANDIVSGSISSAFQGAAARLLHSKNITYNGDSKYIKYLKYLEKTKGYSSEMIASIQNNAKVIPEYVFKIIENVGLKGITSGELKNLSNFLFEESDLIAKCLTGEATEKEEDEFLGKLAIALKKGLINGALTGALLTLFDFANSKTVKKSSDELKKKLEKKLNDAGTDKKQGDVILKGLNDALLKIETATGNTIARTVSASMQGKKQDSNDIFKTGFKEISKQIFK